MEQATELYRQCADAFAIHVADTLIKELKTYPK